MPHNLIMHDIFEIQINEDVENSAIRGFYSALNTNDPEALKITLKRCLDRYKRVVKGCIIMQEAYLNFHGIKNTESHIIILHPGGYAEIINVDPPEDLNRP